MAGHSKGTGQAPTGLYIPQAQLHGAPGQQRIVRPEYLHRELQAIARASKVLEDRLVAAESAIVTAESDIDTLQTDMTAAESDIDDLETAMTAAESDIDDLESDVSILTNELVVGYLNNYGETPLSTTTLAANSYRGLPMFAGTNSEYFTTDTTTYGSRTATKVVKSGLYFYQLCIHCYNMNTDGATWPGFLLEGYDSVWGWRVYGSSVLPKDNDNWYLATITGIRWIPANSYLAFHNESTTAQLSYGEQNHRSWWSVAYLRT
jgi:cell division protein FtsL